MIPNHYSVPLYQLVACTTFSIEPGSCQSSSFSSYSSILTFSSAVIVWNRSTNGGSTNSHWLSCPSYSSVLFVKSLISSRVVTPLQTSTRWNIKKPIKGIPIHTPTSTHTVMITPWLTPLPLLTTPNTMTLTKNSTIVTIMLARNEIKNR